MSGSQSNTNQTTDTAARGTVKTISKNVDSPLEPVEIFQGLAESLQLKNAILLESSEINSRESVQSILMLQAAVRIECIGQQVMVSALTANGRNALKHIAKQLQITAKDIASNTSSYAIEVGEETLQVTYPILSSVVDEDSRLKQASPIDCLRKIKDSFVPSGNNAFSIFLSGLFSYDLIASFENLPPVEQGDAIAADYVFYLAEKLLLIDHQKNTKRFLCNHFSGDNEQNTYYELARSFETFESDLAKLTLRQTPTTSSDNKVALKESAKVSVDLSDQQYQQVVKQLKQNIVKGDVFQVVPSRTFSIACTSPMNSYRQLKRANPSPYMFYMLDQDFILFGASPESSLKYCAQKNEVELYPIAGTRPRGKNAAQQIDLDLDARIEAELKLDHKEVSEHMMLVDLARNDIARIALPGSTHVPRLLEVDRYSQVMHLVSCVRGNLRSDLDALHAYQACMNMGTLTGAPKIKATELIRQIEGKRRGSYGGAVGYLNAHGDMDSCIVIRSAFFRHGVAHIQAGAGIVFDSIPELEAQETQSKAAAVINAIHLANQLDSGEQST